MADSFISLSGISKVFPGAEVDTHALSEVNLTLRQGEFLCIEGPSGCGKTTLLSILGRTFRPEEGTPGNEYVVVLSHGLWQERYGGDPKVIGRQLVIDTEPHTIIGIAAPSFGFPSTRTSRCTTSRPWTSASRRLTRRAVPLIRNEGCWRGSSRPGYTDARHEGAELDRGDCHGVCHIVRGRGAVGTRNAGRGADDG